MYCDFETVRLFNSNHSNIVSHTHSAVYIVRTLPQNLYMMPLQTIYMFCHFGKATKYLHQPKQTVMKLSTVYYTHSSLYYTLNELYT